MLSETASVVDDLNRMLEAERGEAEAVKVFLEGLPPADADIAESGKDVLTTASWSCSGLYHRIVQMGGVATLESGDAAERLAEIDGTKSRLEFLCKSQREHEEMIRAVLARRGLDGPTRDFLKELLRAHEETATWCRDTLMEWEHD